MANEISIYQNNSKTVIATISGLASLTGYTSVLTVKKQLSDTGATFTSNGTINGLTITFNLTPTNTNITPDNYHYDITLSNGVKNYTAIQSVMIILDSVKY